MQLLDHLKATEEGVSAFADRIGVKRTTIRKIAYGQRQPSLELAMRIERETGGLFTPTDLILPVTQAAA
jgi:DNA-binding transcriptional regulator YdaS (Cro superfamily)